MNWITSTRNLTKLLIAFWPFGILNAFTMATQVNEIIQNEVANWPGSENTSETCEVMEPECKRVPYGLLPAPKEQ